MTIKQTLYMIRHHLKSKTLNIHILAKSGIYQIKCNNRQLKYVVGQTEVLDYILRNISKQ
jgi:hypothetical protein